MLKRTRPERDLLRAIVVGVVWVLIGIVQAYAFADHGALARLALGLVTLPLLWVAARSFAAYWRGRGEPGR